MVLDDVAYLVSVQITKNVYQQEVQTEKLRRIYTNNEQFRIELPEEVQGVEVIVDCAAQVTYYVSGGSKVAINQHTYGEYPLLHVGTNYIRHAGTVSAASINVKERWL